MSPQLTAIEVLKPALSLRFNHVGAFRRFWWSLGHPRNRRNPAGDRPGGPKGASRDAPSATRPSKRPPEPEDRERESFAVSFMFIAKLLVVQTQAKSKALIRVSQDQGLPSAIRVQQPCSYLGKSSENCRKVDLRERCWFQVLRKLQKPWAKYSAARIRRR